MAKRRPARWLLLVLAPAALIVAGCGTDSHAHPKLRAADEQRLLSLITRARADAAHQNRAGVRGALAKFVSEVDTLRSSGELTVGSAGAMKRQALATAALAAERWPLHHTTSTTTTQEVSGTGSQTAVTAAQSQPDPQRNAADTTPPGQPADPPAGASPAKPSPAAPATPPHGPAAGHHHPWWSGQPDGPGHGGPHHPGWHGGNGGGHG